MTLPNSMSVEPVEAVKVTCRDCGQSAIFEHQASVETWARDHRRRHHGERYA